MSDIARNILTTVFCFSKSKGNIIHDTIDMQDGVPIHIKDITVIPHICCHSAYGSFMFLIEASTSTTFPVLPGVTIKSLPSM